MPTYLNKTNRKIERNNTTFDANKKTMVNFYVNDANLEQTSILPTVDSKIIYSKTATDEELYPKYFKGYARISMYTTTYAEIYLVDDSYAIKLISGIMFESKILWNQISKIKVVGAVEILVEGE